MPKRETSLYVSFGSGVRRAAPLLAALSLVMVACGSTVPRGQESTSTVQRGQESTEATTAFDEVSNSAGEGATADSTKTRQRVGHGGSGTPAAVGSGPTTGLAESLGEAGGGRIPIGPGTHGVTDREIQFGIWYWDAATAGAAISGLTGNPGTAQLFPDRKDIQKIVDYINSHGGVAGRKLAPIWVQGDATRAGAHSTRDQEEQRMCAAWTEDHHVFGFLMLYGRVLRECALRSNSVIVNTTWGTAVMSESMLSRGYGDLWYSPDRMAAERRGRALVEGLWSQKFFTKGAKIGILTRDDQAAKDGIANGVIPALAKHGMKPALQIVYPDGIESPWSSYVLQLQSSGITHILMSQDEMIFYPPFFAMRAAEDQRYYPHWGFSTDQQPATLTGLGAPRNQLANVAGVGWQPVLDGTVNPLDPPIQSSTGATCDKLMEQHDLPGSTSSYCEPLFFLQFALDRATEISPRGMSAAMARVANQYPSTLTIGGATSFSPDQHNGPSVYRFFDFDSTRCTDDGQMCFKYVTPARPLPP